MNEEILRKINKSNKNLIISGNLSTGKTKNIGMPIINKIVESNESFFVLDSKEEYINRYYNLVKEKGYNTIIINLRNPEKSEGWNFLEYPYELYKKGEIDKTLNYLEQIGKGLFYEGSIVDPFWGNSAADLFTGITLGLYEDASKEKININSINNMVNALDDKIGNSNYLTEYFKMKDVNSPAYICASGTVLAPSDTRAGIISVSKQKLRFLVSSICLSKLLNKTTFDFNEIINKPTAIFFISKDEDKKFNILTSAFINQLYLILVEKNNKNQFNFILDNFDSINNIYGLIDILSSCIYRKIKFTIITRSIEELENDYGKYINHLSNKIYVNDEDVKFVIDNKIETTINNNNEMEFSKIKIDYPKNNIDSIKVFDYREFMNNQKSFKDNITKYNINNNIDKLMTKIDSKFEEIEKTSLYDK